MSFQLEAQACRRDAEVYAGRPEADFLLRAAETFEQLAERTRESVPGDRPDASAIGQVRSIG